jgi:hypothetical protein
LDAGKQGQPNLIQSHPRPHGRSPHRRSGRKAARYDAMDQTEGTGGQGQELRFSHTFQRAAFAALFYGASPVNYRFSPRHCELSEAIQSTFTNVFHVDGLL